jgi:nucleoside diphosphate kinase
MSERALVLLKPDIIAHVDTILYRFNRAGYKILNRTCVRLTEEQAADFFQEYMDNPRFKEQISHIIR